jgi:peptidoglycan/xylan/chitin deacetylase (PgdA/CDA1 family)
MNLENKYGFKSTFFFLTTKRDLKPRYNINNLKNILKKIHENGWEVGLHAGFNSYDNLEKLRSEKKKLESVLGHSIYGVRNHYLRFSPPESWILHEKAGFMYDTTLGFREISGFRAGYCLPYFPYDYIQGKKINIVELPMVIMDSALLSIDKPKKRITELLDHVKKHNGLLVINWHQCSFDEKDYSARLEMYKYLLKLFKEERAYVTTGHNIVECFNKKIID